MDAFGVAWSSVSIPFVDDQLHHRPSKEQDFADPALGQRFNVMDLKRHLTCIAACKACQRQLAVLMPRFMIGSERQTTSMSIVKSDIVRRSEQGSWYYASRNAGPWCGSGTLDYG